MAISVVMSSDKSSKNFLKSGEHRFLVSPSASMWRFLGQSALDGLNGTRTLRQQTFVDSSLSLVVPNPVQLVSVYNPAQQCRHASHQQQIFTDVCGKTETGQDVGNVCDLLSMVRGC